MKGHEKLSIEIKEAMNNLVEAHDLIRIVYDKYKPGRSNILQAHEKIDASYKFLSKLNKSMDEVRGAIK